MHKPVLLSEVIEILDPKLGDFFIDGTVDGGGHALAILERIGSNGIFLGIDWDGELLKQFKFKIESAGRRTKFESNIILVNDNYKNMKKILKENNLGKAAGILLDLGFSSEQLEFSGRGFSFRKDEPLLMTYSTSMRPAYEWLKRLNVRALTKIIREFGEEHFAERIARAIKNNLPIATSKKLANVIAAAVPKFYERGRIHPATRTFQALRIFVNQELDNLRSFLADLPSLMNQNGRAAIISFNSLEDRIVKQSFRDFAKAGVAEILTKKPIIPSPKEIRENPRSRSAKLRSIKFL
jgi:16S rRNA (cytosine1402-N4)-methyltransferase